MDKDFTRWHVTKQRIQDNAIRGFYREGEVCWCALGLNIGVETDGKGKSYTRPVLILKAFGQNAFLGIPVTSKIKTGKFYYDLNLGDGVPRQAMLSQIRFMDAKRLNRKITAIAPAELLKIKQAAREIIS